MERWSSKETRDVRSRDGKGHGETGDGDGGGPRRRRRLRECAWVEQSKRVSDWSGKKGLEWVKKKIKKTFK